MLRLKAHVVSVCFKCFRCFIGMLQVFYMDVYICCNGCTRMLQSFVPNVLSVFSDVYCKCVYLVVAYVSHICLQVFYLDVAYVFAMVSSVFSCVL
jgi:hypothetical protein